MEAVTLFRDALILVVLLSAPALLITTVLGVLISIVQGLFQIQDQALAYTVKVVALVVVLLLTGRWMQTEIVSLANQMFFLLGRVR
jgi:type III secretion protein S